MFLLFQHRYGINWNHNINFMMNIYIKLYKTNSILHEQVRTIYCSIISEIVSDDNPDGSLWFICRLYRNCCRVFWLLGLHDLSPVCNLAFEFSHVNCWSFGLLGFWTLCHIEYWTYPMVRHVSKCSSSRQVKLAKDVPSRRYPVGRLRVLI
jgi:hypothetical protein